MSEADQKCPRCKGEGGGYGPEDEGWVVCDDCHGIGFEPGSPAFNECAGKLADTEACIGECAGSLLCPVHFEIDRVLRVAHP